MRATRHQSTSRAHLVEAVPCSAAPQSSQSRPPCLHIMAAGTSDEQVDCAMCTQRELCCTHTYSSSTGNLSDCLASSSQHQAAFEGLRTLLALRQHHLGPQALQMGCTAGQTRVAGDKVGSRPCTSGTDSTDRMGPAGKQGRRGHSRRMACRSVSYLPRHQHTGNVLNAQREGWHTFRMTRRSKE